QRTAGDEVHSRIQIPADILLGHIAGTLCLRSAADQFHRLFHSVGIHVVQHDNIRAGFHRFLTISRFSTSISIFRTKGAYSLAISMAFFTPPAAPIWLSFKSMPSDRLYR